MIIIDNNLIIAYVIGSAIGHLVAAAIVLVLMWIDEYKRRRRWRR
jgi:hypothetical protein